MDRGDKYSLLLLVGGKSSRMGKNKAELLYKGKTFVQQLIDKSRALGITDIYLSGYHQEEERVHIVWDIFPDRGPLGGLHACMKEIETPYCLVLPVDVPQIPQEVLEMLLSHHEESGSVLAGKEVPLLLKHGDRKEHLIGIYPVLMMDAIEERIKDHSASVHGMLEDWGYNCLSMDIPDWQVDNINTPEAYRVLLGKEEKEC